MKRIYSSHNLAVVHHLRNLLETEGIKAVVKNQFLSSAMGDLPPAECMPELWLLSDADADRAERFLKEALSAKTGPAWICPSCKETSEGQFTQCWRCGAYRPA